MTLFRLWNLNDLISAVFFLSFSNLLQFRKISVGDEKKIHNEKCVIRGGKKYLIIETVN